MQWSFTPQNVYEIAHWGKNYNCNQCEYKTAHSSSLKMHKRKHTGEKLHHCNQCEYKTAKSRNLQTHKKTHSGGKPERCTICEYSCIRTSSLKVHMMQEHTGERPFKCVQCNLLLPNLVIWKPTWEFTWWRDHSSATSARKLTNRRGTSQDMLGLTKLQIR